MRVSFFFFVNFLTSFFLILNTPTPAKKKQKSRRVSFRHPFILIIQRIEPMPWHFIAAGVAVGLGCAIYANREEIKQEFEAFVEHVKLWNYERQQRYRSRGGRTQGQRRDNDEVFDLDEFYRQSEQRQGQQQGQSQSQGQSSGVNHHHELDENINLTSFYTTGETSSAAAPTVNTANVRDRSNNNNNNSNSTTARTIPFTHHIDTDIRSTTTNDDLSSHTDSPASLTPPASSRSNSIVDNWHLSDDSYSEISTPSRISDFDDYQHAMLSDDDERINERARHFAY